LLQEDLQAIDIWMTRNKLQLNVSKTTMMVIAPAVLRESVRDVSIQLSGISIKSRNYENPWSHFRRKYVLVSSREQSRFWLQSHTQIAVSYPKATQYRL
jgi:hypothetical protein